jgi:DNA-binding transcriptional regulator YiaG
MKKEKIKKQRRLLDLNQNEYAHLFGVHSMTVSKWERGIASPSSLQTAMMSEIFLAIRNRMDVSTIKDRLVRYGPIYVLNHILYYSLKV